VKFSILVGAVAGVAICATAATAQVCQGDLPFRNRATHVGGSIGLSDNATSFAGGLSRGHAKGWYGGASVGMLQYDNNGGNSLIVGGGLGYSMPVQARSKWQVCPGGTLSLGFGPSIDVGANTMKMSSQTISLGASFGTSVAMSRTKNLLPFVSAAFGHTRVSAKLNGNSTSASDNYLLVGAGAGFQLTPALVLRPSMALAAGADLIDDTTFGFGITWALPR
jgi:outer membrane protein with beta-barrel domain